MTDRSISHAIVTTSLTKHYGSVAALENVSIRVPAQSIYGFLGPNGAGKTTLIRLLLGFIRATSGRAEILGHESWSDGVRARENIGFLVPSGSLYPEMSGIDQLEYASRLSGREPALRGDLLDLLELSRTDLDRTFAQYSKGMKQKLALICAAQHDPDVLILDEPTDGLDPLIRRRFESFLAEFNQRGRTIFMSSHDLAEVDRVCDFVAIVREGKLVREQPVDEFRQAHNRRAEIVFTHGIPDEIGEVGEVVEIDPTNCRVVVQLGDSTNEFVAFLARHDIADLTVSSPRFDDVFMSFYQHNGRPVHVESGDPGMKHLVTGTDE